MFKILQILLSFPHILNFQAGISQGQPKKYFEKKTFRKIFEELKFSGFSPQQKGRRKNYIWKCTKPDKTLQTSSLHPEARLPLSRAASCSHSPVCDPQLSFASGQLASNLYSKMKYFKVLII